MQTRKDHVQAYQFAMARLATALVSGDPGGGESPTRRASLGTFIGAGIVVLLCVGFLVFGLISPVAKTDWKQDGAVVVQEENGNRLLYTGGQLHPVRNLASAMLISGKDAAAPQSVSAKSLAGTRIGPAVGILNAPDAVPAHGSLLTGAWTRCLRPEISGGQVVDFAPAGHTSAQPIDRQVLLAGPDGTRYVLWDGTKFKVSGDASLIALGMENQQPVAAPKDWLAAVTTGPNLAAPAIPGRGRAAGQIAGEAAQVGDVFRTGGAGQAHDFVMLSDGVAPVSPTTAALLSASASAAPRKVSATDIASAPVSKNRSMLRSLPDVLNMRPLQDRSSAVCLRQRSVGSKLHSSVVLERGEAATGSRRVLIPPGRGVLAVDQDQLAAQASSPATFLVTEDGTSFPLASDQADTALGLSRGSALPLPENVLKLLRRGPVLSRAAAIATVRAE